MRNKKQSKRHWKKTENLKIKQKYIKNYPRNKSAKRPV